MVVRYLEVDNFRAFGARTRIPSGEDGDFSAVINVFVGPNGSGKTTIMNAFKQLFGRDSENSQGPLTPGTRGVKREDHARMCGKPWSVLGFVQDASGLVPAGTMEVVGDAAGGKRRRFFDENNAGLIPTKEWLSDAHWNDEHPWCDFYDLGFPCGWPRQVRNLDQKCFGRGEEKSPVFYERHWDKIRDDVKICLGFDPGGPGLLRGSDMACCPQCGAPSTDRDRRSVGDRLLGASGEPLLQGSDGQSHFLYLIMELRKFDELRRPTAFFLEEPDVYMHPALQKRFFDYILELHKERGDQFFLTTHSPYLMDITAKHPPSEGNVQLYRCRHVRGGAVVRKVNFKESWNLLYELGHRPSDVMHPNGIIWVEGPSDRIYIRQWLDKYAEMPGRKPIQWGLDAEILWYGGSLVARLGYDSGAWGQMSEGEQGDPVNLCMTHQNAAILVDRDAGDDGTKGWKNKTRVMGEFEKANCVARMTGPRTIEGYLAREYRGRFGVIDGQPLRDGFDRVKTARDYCRDGQGRALYEIVDEGTDIVDLLDVLYRAVDQWRDVSAVR